MTRQNLSDGLVEWLKGANGFDASSTGTVAAHDHRVLAQGVDRAAVVLNDTGEQRRMAKGGLNAMDWRFAVGLYIRHNNDVVQARKDSDTYCQNLIDRVNADPTLGGSAFDAIVETVRVEDERMVIGGRPFLVEVLTVKATEILQW